MKKILIFIQLFILFNIKAQTVNDCTLTPLNLSDKDVIPIRGYNTIIDHYNNVPYIAYIDKFLGFKVFVKKLVNGKWKTLGNAAVSVDTVALWSLSMDIDSNGNPYLLYVNNTTNGIYPEVKKFDGNNWVTVGTGAITTGAYLNFFNYNITLDANDIPYISFYDLSGLHVMKFNGIAWANVGTVITTSYAERPKIKFDNNNNLFVAYISGGAYVSTFNGSVWSLLGGIPVFSQQVNDISMDISRTNNIVVAYTTSDSSKISVKTFSNGNWNFIGSQYISLSNSNGLSMSLDTLGVPYIFYESFNLSDYGRLIKKLSGFQWITVGQSFYFSGDNYVDRSIHIDKDNVPYVFYSDVTNTDYYNHKLFVKKLNSGYWGNYGEQNFPAQTSVKPAFGVNSVGIPYLFYFNPDSSKATLIKYYGNSWSKLADITLTSTLITELALSFGQNDTVIVGYNNNGANVMKFNGTSFIPLGSSFSPLQITNFVMTSIPSGDIFTAFRDNTDNLYRASVMKFSGNSWTYVGPYRFTGNNITNLSLAVNNNGTPYLSSNGNNGGNITMFDGSTWIDIGASTFTNSAFPYLAVNSNGSLYALSYNSVGAFVSNFNGVSWTNIGNTGFNDNAIFSNNDIFIDNSGIIYVAQTDNKYRCTIKKYNGTTWTTVDTPGFTTYPISGAKIAVDNNGIGYVAFNEAGTFIYKFAGPCTSINEHFNEGVLELLAFPNPFENYIILNNKNFENERYSIEIFNLLGEKLQTGNTTGENTVFNTSNLSPGIYLLSISNGYSKKIIKIIKE